jgi:hypothetical protein
MSSVKRLADVVFPLTIAAFAMDLVHDLDHIRRHNYSPIAVRSLGFFALAAGILVVTLAVGRSKLAVPLACLYGFASGVGLFAVHVLPHWSLFSDPLTIYHVDALSWTIVGVTIVVDLALGIGAAARLSAGTAPTLEAGTA